jgi:hypothetical protein
MAARAKSTKSRDHELLSSTAPKRPVRVEVTQPFVPASMPDDPGPAPKACPDASPFAAQVQLPAKTGPPDSSPADDLLIGASRIAAFLFGSPHKRRAVYHLAEKGVLPAFKWGGVLVARKTTLLAFLADRERVALANLAIETD